MLVSVLVTSIMISISINMFLRACAEVTHVAGSLGFALGMLSSVPARVIHTSMRNVLGWLRVG